MSRNTLLARRARHMRTVQPLLGTPSPQPTRLDYDACGRVLLAALREEPAPARATAWIGASRHRSDLLHRATVFHGLPGFVSCALERSGDVPPAVLDRFEASCDEALARHLRSVAELRWISGVLEGLGGPWAVMKGPVLADHHYRSGRLRSYDDLDIVVHHEAFGDALSALERSGATLLDRNWPMIRETLRAELALLLPHGTVADLHWSVLNEARWRSAFPMSTSAMLGRSRRVPLGGATVPTFDGADTLVHIAAHAALSGARRLVWLKDIERVIAADAPDWDLVVERSNEGRVGVLVATMLRRARLVLCTDFGGLRLDRLDGPAAWAAIMRLSERLLTPSSWVRLRRTGRTFVSASRPSSLESIEELGAALGLTLQRMYRSLLESGGLRTPSTGVSDLQRDVASREDRDAYLRSVTSGSAGR